MAGPGDPTNPADVSAAASQVAVEQNLAVAGSAEKSAEALNASSTAATGNAKSLTVMSGALTAATAALFGVSQATAKFVEGIDTAKITTFSKQLDAVTAVITRQGTVSGDAQKLIGGMLSSLSNMGNAIPTKIMEGFISGTVDGAKAAFDYIKTIAKAGDELHTVRMGMIEWAAAAGNLDDVLNRAGDNMQSFDQIASRQQAIWDNAAAATGIAVEDVAKYSAELNKVPGVLKTMMTEVTAGNQGNKLFMDTLNLFRISGRQYADIVKDMTTATKELGLNERQAFEYTARLSSTAKEIGVPFEDFHKAISQSATAFKMFTTEGKAGDAMAKNLQATMAGYIQQLRASNIPMSNAIEMAEHFSGAMNEMGIAQKAFLSSMTGGPGGLMGAYQIEKMLDEGKIDQVFGKVQSALRKQFGRIVTTEEASRSQAAAEQMTRQVMILRQGPLGAFAKTDAEARRLLESMSRGRSPEQAIKEMKKDQPESMEKLLGQGNKIAQATQGLMQQFLVGVSRLEHGAAPEAAKITEAGLGARTFFRPGEGAGLSPETMDQRREVGARGAMPGGATLMEAAVRDMKGIPSAVRATMSALGVAIKGGKQESIDEARAAFEKSVADSRKMVSADKRDDFEKAMQNATNVTEAAVAISKVDMTPSVPAPGEPGTTTAAPTVPPPTGTTPTTKKGPTIPSPGTASGRSPADAARIENQVNAYMRAHGVNHGEAVRRLGVVEPTKGADTGTAAAAPGAGAGHGRPMPVTLAPGTTLNVHFSGVCPHCKNRVDTTEAQNIVPTATK